MNFTTPHPRDKQTYGQQQNLTTNIQEQLHKAQILARTKQIKYKSYLSTNTRGLTYITNYLGVKRNL